MSVSLRAAAAVAAVFIATTPGPAEADDELEPATRLEAVARATAARVTGRPAAEIEVRASDPRLRLAACASSPTGRLAPGTRSPTLLTIEVRCQAPAWRQYVAVRLSSEEPVVVSLHPLGRGEAVTEAAVTVVTRELDGLPAGYFRSPADVVGRIAQRTIGAGEVLSPSTVRPPPVVRRGQSVTVVARAGGLAVKTAGIALADAGIAERVRVRNASTGRQVEGIVRSGDTVEVAVE